MGKINYPIQAPRGMKDLLPDDWRYFSLAESTIDQIAIANNFSRIEPPIAEYGDFFIRGIGEATEIIQKQMFFLENRVSFSRESQSEDINRKMVLRPEYTTGVCRAYLEQGMKSWPQPIKLWYFGPCFRYERPQAGRYRQFYQTGVEVLGDNNPLTDALLIFLAINFLKALGLKEQLVVNINSIGCPDCRPRIVRKIRDYLKKSGRDNLCAICQLRLSNNPLRVLDCQEKNCQQITAEAPSIIDNLCPTCAADFRLVLESMDDLGINYNLLNQLVRGLDYYTKTIFEINKIEDVDRRLTLIGGGRYDGLISSLGGEPTPGVGWSAGVERLTEEMKNTAVKLPKNKQPKLFIVMFGDNKVRRYTLKIIKKLTNCNVGWQGSFSKTGLKSQLRAADRSDLKDCLIIGQREAFDNTIIWRDLKTASQESLSEKQFLGKIEKLEKRLTKLK